MIDVTGIIVYHTHIPCGGPVAEWLCSGLQNRVHRFNSGPGLHRLCVFFYVSCCNIDRLPQRCVTNAFNATVEIFPSSLRRHYFVPLCCELLDVHYRHCLGGHIYRTKNRDGNNRPYGVHLCPLFDRRWCDFAICAV